MKKITKIENKITTEKIRVAAYCRVSTDMADQLESLEAQKSHYEQYIGSNCLWSFAGIYYDEGISGTKKEKRPALLNLIKDCEDGKIDLVVTKSVSRFSRNTTDCLELVRHLSSLGISIQFEQERINTGNMEGELLLTVLSSLAEQESVSISKNCKWSVKKRFEDGSYVVVYPPYGYKKDKGEMIIDPEEAEIVKGIFKSYLSGKSTYTIAKYLTKVGIPSRKAAKWSSTTVGEILNNEKYTGDAIFQKTWTDENFNRHLNHGDVDSYLVKNHHEPIVSIQDFEAVQELMNARRSEKGLIKDNNKYTARYLLSGSIKCGECGKYFKRRICKRGENKYISWACATHLEDKTECSMKAVRQDQIEAAFTTMINKLIFAQHRILTPFIKGISTVDKIENAEKIQKLEEEIKNNVKARERLMTFLQMGIIDSDLINSESSFLLSEYKRLCKERDQFKSLEISNCNYAKLANELLKYVRETPIGTVFDGDAFFRFIDHVTVISQHELDFNLTCGLVFREKI